MTLPLASVGMVSNAVPALLAMLLSGAFAIVLGIIGWKAIQRSSGHLYGLGLAGGGMAIALLTVLFVGVIVPNI